MPHECAVSGGTLRMRDRAKRFACPYCVAMMEQEVYVKDGQRRQRCAACGAPVPYTPVQPNVALLHRPRVLVIDDDPLLRALLSRALDAHGFEVQVAPDGAHGLQTARATRPAVVLIDLLLPGVNGLEVCRRLRADPLFRALPIILMSAHADGLDETGRAAGATIAIPKPMDVQVLVRILRQVSTVPTAARNAETRRETSDVAFPAHAG